MAFLTWPRPPSAFGSLACRSLKPHPHCVSASNVVDNTGALIDTITYDGYGNVTTESSAANGGNYKAFAYRVDDETGWLRPDPSTDRYYSSSTGRWPTPD